MFSTYTKSFTANGAVTVVNPRVGVERTQVTTPAGDENTLLIPTPLLLLIANTFDSVSERPLGTSSISTRLIDEPCTLAARVPTSYGRPVSGFTSTRSGTDVYPDPPEFIVIPEIVFLFTMTMLGEMKSYWTESLV